MPVNSVKRKKGSGFTASSDATPTGRWPRRALAVRMLAARLAFLDGRLRWVHGRAGWENGEGCFFPAPGDIARAQRALYRIRQYPFAAREALGDPESWRAERQARLELTKRLLLMPTADDETHLSRLPLTRLAELLIAEALCHDNLPGPPSRLLLHAAAPALPLLTTFAGDTSLPAPARALAALTAGAIYAQCIADEPRSRPASSLPSASETYLRRAFAYGMRNGLPESEPALIACLLLNDNGEEWARQWEEVRTGVSAPRMGLPPLLLRGLLLDGAADAAQVVAAAQMAALRLEPLAERLLSRRDDLPPLSRRQQREAAAGLLRAQRESAAAMLAERVREYVRAAQGNPGIVEAIARFLEKMLALGPVTTPLVNITLDVLTQGLTLPASLQQDFLELVIERHGDIWDPKKQAEQEAHRPGYPTAAWLQQQWEFYGTPLRHLLCATGDAALVREAVRLNLQRLLVSHAPDRDKGRCRFFLEVMGRFVDGGENRHLTHTLLRTLQSLDTEKEMRAVLRPLLDALPGSGSRAAAADVLESLLDGVPQTRQGRREMLPRLARFVPRLLALAESVNEPEYCPCDEAAESAVVLLRTAPEARAAEFLNTLLDCLKTGGGGKGYNWEKARALPLAAALGAAIAGDDPERFLPAVRAVIMHPPEQHQERIRRGIDTLKTYPGLREPISRLLPQSPRRCLDLLSRIGAATHLSGEEALAPLALCHFDETCSPSCEMEDEHWRQVIDLAPDAAPTVAAYWYACWLAGRPTDVPAGVLHALEEAGKRTRELEFLEDRIAREPHRTDLQARAESLRARLGDGDRLRSRIAGEVRERLEILTAEVQMEAAEIQVSACYRARLESIIGPVNRRDGTATAAISGPDWENATLLAATVTKNRRLLVKFLRAWAAGDREAHARHPANVAFRKALTERGVEADTWLAAHSRRVRCPEAAGGWLRLRLETDPLAVLQMGNYFGTCLSADGFNAFSTVANAVEQNKRVLYVRDGAGRVVGRKLIGMNEEGKVVGFHLYCAFSREEAGRAALCRAVDRYLRDFAAVCGLELADAGSVTRLFTEDWYDDGTVGWDAAASDEEDGEEEAPRPHSVSAKARRRRRRAGSHRRRGSISQPRPASPAPPVVIPESADWRRETGPTAVSARRAQARSERYAEGAGASARHTECPSR